VTHTKRIDRNLLRKETSFVCYTSSVLIQIESTKHTKLVSLRNKLRSIRLVWVTVVALQILLNF